METELLQLARATLVVAIALIAVAAAFMGICVYAVTRAIRSMAETCSEAMDNVVAACDLPAAIYGMEQRELKKAEGAPRDLNPEPVERDVIK